MLNALIKKAERFPDLPGVYLLKDETGLVLYVGKARSLRRRIKSYLVDRSALAPRLRLLQSKLAELDYVVTDTEVEALVLECNLIKEYRPRFNVNMKDDKDYPYLMLTGELYPRLELLRLSQKNSRRGRYRPSPGKDERYFGPYTNAGAIRDTMRLLCSILPLRRCRHHLEGRPTGERPCLNYQMKRCLAPCLGAEIVTPEEYAGVVRQTVLFLEGRYSELEKKLAAQMEKAAGDERFEEAAALRDRLSSLRAVSGERQKVLEVEKAVDRDIIALARLGRRSAAYLFKVREGKLVSQDHFLLSGTADVEDSEIMGAFIKTYYNRVAEIPQQIVLSTQPAEHELLQEWLKLQAGRKVTLRLPRRGALKKLVELAMRNCMLYLQEEEKRRNTREVEPLAELAALLNLNSPPARIEGYDISHLHGDKAVGAMVVFNEGSPSKEDYRQFNIRSAQAGDDYGALQEVLRRRAKNETWPLPDLILVDGGKGQLSAVSQVLSGTCLEAVPRVSFAKNPDQLHIEEAAVPLRLSANSTLLQFLQRIRDEVHRFAISRHRARRRRAGTESQLEKIAGVGPARRAALLKHFGSFDRLLQAPVEKISAAPGISSSLAAKIYRHLHGG